MSFGDKLKHQAEEASGKVKETTGKATDDESMEAEGKADQSEANVKQAGDKAKDAAERRQGRVQELTHELRRPDHTLVRAAPCHQLVGSAGTALDGLPLGLVHGRLVGVRPGPRSTAASGARRGP